MLPYIFSDGLGHVDVGLKTFLVFSDFLVKEPCYHQILHIYFDLHTLQSADKCTKICNLILLLNQGNTRL